jgi:hypothetical protein
MEKILTDKVSIAKDDNKVIDNKLSECLKDYNNLFPYIKEKMKFMQKKWIRPTEIDAMLIYNFFINYEDNDLDTLVNTADRTIIDLHIVSAQIYLKFFLEDLHCTPFSDQVQFLKKFIACFVSKMEHQNYWDMIKESYQKNEKIYKNVNNNIDF